MLVGVLGYRYDHYSYIRNIIAKVPGVEYCKTRDLFAMINALAHMINHLANREVVSTFDVNHQFYDLGLNRVDLLHLYNGISYGRTPWVTTFETLLPRFRKAVEATHGANPDFMLDRKIRKGLAMLAGSSCKQIIAMSECAARMQRALLVGLDPYREKIERKLVVMHPPQEPMISRFEEKAVDLNGRINFMFVGNAFFRKGGREVIETLAALRGKHQFDIGLTIVSDMRLDGYATYTTPEDVQRTAVLIQENRGWIEYYPHLRNAEVLALMKKHHIGLLPTYADSYGYSVLELQACGCPVITTNIRTLPEINDHEKGWVIEVPKNRLGEAIYTTASDRMAISMAIRNGLEKAIREIYSNRSVIRIKSEMALAGIREEHSREKFAAQMKNIYINAVSQAEVSYQHD